MAIQEKKFLILLILKILETESDEQHPISQTQIAHIISGKYPCDRKTVGRNIHALMKVGYPIQKTPKGFFLSRRSFSIEERDFILRAVRNADGLPEAEKEMLLERLEKLLRSIKR